jgi:hypothetical protein
LAECELEQLMKRASLGAGAADAVGELAAALDCRAELEVTLGLEELGEDGDRAGLSNES